MKKKITTFEKKKKNMKTVNERNYFHFQGKHVLEKLDYRDKVKWFWSLIWLRK